MSGPPIIDDKVVYAVWMLSIGEGVNTYNIQVFNLFSPKKLCYLFNNIYYNDKTPLARLKYTFVTLIERKPMPNCTNIAGWLV